MAKAADKSIEQLLSELEQILEQMESGSITLEESFASYEAGMKLVKRCSEKIDKVEKKMLVLQEGDAADEQ